MPLLESSDMTVIASAMRFIKAAEERLQEAGFTLASPLTVLIEANGKPAGSIVGTNGTRYAFDTDEAKEAPRPTKGNAITAALGNALEPETADTINELGPYAIAQLLNDGLHIRDHLDRSPVSRPETWRAMSNAVDDLIVRGPK